MSGEGLARQIKTKKREPRKALRGALVGLVFIGISAQPIIAQEPSFNSSAPQSAPASFAPLVERVEPAVVNISTTAVVKPKFQSDEDAPDAGSNSPFGEFLRRFHQGSPNGKPRKLTALGSGFIIDSSGLVVTNNHVIENASEIKVTLQDGTVLEATVVGRDLRTDLAVIKVKSDRPLLALAFGDSNAVHVGDWLVSIGNPFGLGGTVTAGILSARSRDIHAGPYDDFLQIDAPINQGNSGGPTFNLDGQVIGINTAILSPDGGGSVGIGFAIPSNLAQKIIAQIKTGNAVTRGWLGVTVQDVSPEVGKAMGDKAGKGALITQVAPGSPAALVGLKTGDIVLKYSGATVGTIHDLTRAVADTPIGAARPLEYLRKGQPRTVSVTITKLKDDRLASAADTDQTDPADGDTGLVNDQLGIKLSSLSNDLRRQLHISRNVTSGVVITDVAPGSVADDDGIAPGDIILEVNDKNVAAPKDVISAIRQATEARQKSIAFLLNRAGNNQFVALQLGKS